MQPGTVYEVLERDNGYVQVWDAVRWFTPPYDWSASERWGHCQATGRVLDIGCGAGRHALPLLRAGLDVMGVDPSPGVVAVAKDRGLRVVRTGVESLPDALGYFDSFLLLGGNLGLLGDEGRAVRLLNRLACLARPGARLLGSGLDPFATGHPDRRKDHDPDYQEENLRQARLPGQTRMRVRYRRTVTEWFDHTYFSEGELRQLVRATPWEVGPVLHDDLGYCAMLCLP